MSITVHEILSLKKFNTFRLIAGANGLNRKVLRSGFVDHESAEELEQIAFKNEIIFSNLPMLKDNPDAITDYVRAAIQAGCSGFAIKTTFFDVYPDSSIELANECNFPLFLFDDTYIDDLIIDIDDAVNVNKQLATKRLIINSIEEENLNQFKIKTKATELNKYFKERFKIYTISSIEHDIQRFDYKLAQSILGKSSLVLPFENHLLIIYSYDYKNTVNDENVFESLGIIGNYNIGISEEFESLGLLDHTLHQSKSALKFAAYRSVNFVRFNALGVYQMLIPILENKYVVHYYETIVEKLIQYDSKHQSNLLETAEMYVQSDGDIKETAKGLYQHDNTIRYRIRKLNTVLSLEDTLGAKYETLAVAIHLYELSKKQNMFNLL